MARQFLPHFKKEVMKNKLQFRIMAVCTFLSVIGSSNIATAQNVSIPDANFKSALVGIPAINTNNDNEIQISEAAAYTGTINVPMLTISDLTGIETFTALTGLNCSYNQLTSLNTSSNTALTSLFCGNNQLTALNVSPNTALTVFDCSVNHITTLNLSSNTALTILGVNNNNLSALNISTNTSLVNLLCGDNLLTSLNISSNTSLASLDCGNNNLNNLSASGNTALTTLACHGNQLTNLNLGAFTGLKYLSCQLNSLTSLDVSANTILKEIRCYNNSLTSVNVKNGNNANFTAFYAYNNPSLTCIQVDNASYMNTHWSNGKDATATFSESCQSVSTGLATTNMEFEFTVYPNPSSGFFVVQMSNGSPEAKITIHDLIGNRILELYSQGKTTQINLSSEPAGIYFITIAGKNGTGTGKLIKQ
jgi:Leucine-rich repeat (LRR) protein